MKRNCSTYAYIRKKFYITYVKHSENNALNKSIIFNKDQAIYPGTCDIINILEELGKSIPSSGDSAQ